VVAMLAGRMSHPPGKGARTDDRGAIEALIGRSLLKRDRGGPGQASWQLVFG
jgi:hypothetical protein